MRDVCGDDATLILVPIADGGEGTVDVFLAAGATARTVTARGPLGDPVDATYALRGDRAVIEMAAASGLGLAGAFPRIWDATTFGTGDLIRDAIEREARWIIVGIGGSATNDGGAGALAALGARFLDAFGLDVAPSPAGLASVAEIDVTQLEPRLARVQIDIACDVTNPLLGAAGATATYARQKGASTGDLPALEAAIARFARIAVATSGCDLRALPGTGAAGGLGYGLATFTGARLQPGFPLVAEACRLADALRDADWCLTGEGRIDAQTLSGKAVDGVATLARAAGVRVCAFGGSIDPAAERALRGRGVICEPIAAESVERAYAMQHAPELIRAAAARWARALRPA